MTDPVQDGQKGPEIAVPEASPGAIPGGTPAKRRFLGWLARHGYGVLALVCVALWLPGVVSLPALDRDESRFAQSSRQMLDSGNYVDIRFGQVPRYKKPVGIYWLQAATTALAGFGDNSHIWTYRLPSLLGGIVAVWLTFWCGSLFSAEAGLLAGLLLAASVLLTAEATIATTDAVLLASVVGMQGVLLRAYRAAATGGTVSTRMALAGWAAMAAGILVKGPVTPGVGAATIVALLVWDRLQFGSWAWRWLTQLRTLRGLLLAAVLVAPWIVAISLESHGAFLQQSLGGDFAAKLAGGQESHGAPPGYFLLLAALTFWPAILFVLPGIGLAVMRRAEPQIRFVAAWAGAWWIVVEAVPTKLPQYVLPAYPALAILAALWLLTPNIDPADVGKGGWRRWLSVAGVVQFLLGLAILTAGCLLLPGLYGDGPLDLQHGWPVLAAAGVAVLCGVAGSILFLMGKKLTALLAVVVSALLIVPALTAGVGPQLDQMWVSTRLAQLVAKDRAPSDPPPILAGYEEPSMLFALGADIALSDGRGAAELGAARGGIALVEDNERPQFLARLAELEDNATPIDDLSGFNYSRGKTVHVTLYRVTPLHPDALPKVQ